MDLVTASSICNSLNQNKVFQFLDGNVMLLTFDQIHILIDSYQIQIPVKSEPTLVINSEH